MNSRRALLIRILLVLDGFLFGGLFTAWLMRNLLLSFCCNSGPPVWPVYNLLDHIFPYLLFYAAGVLVVGSITVLMWLGNRAR